MPEHGVSIRLGAAVVTATAALMVFTSLAQAQQGEQSQRLVIDLQSEPVLTMGDVMITHAEMDAHMSSLPEEDRTRAVSSVDRVDKLLQGLLVNKVLYQEAMEDDLLQDPNVAASAYRAVVDVLAREQMKQQVTERQLESYEQRARELFLANPQRFSNDQTFSFTHVLVSTAQRSESEAMRRILEVHEAAEDGTSLEDLVGEYSDDEASLERGGSYSDTPAANLDRTVTRALARLDSPGDISEPVRSRFGWHVIRLDRAQDSSEPEWEDVKSRAIEYARQEHAQRIREAYSAELLSPDAIEITPGSIEEFQKRHGFDRELLREATSDS